MPCHDAPARPFSRHQAPVNKLTPHKQRYGTIATIHHDVFVHRSLQEQESRNAGPPGGDVGVNLLPPRRHLIGRLLVQLLVVRRRPGAVVVAETHIVVVAAAADDDDDGGDGGEIRRIPRRAPLVLQRRRYAPPRLPTVHDLRSRFGRVRASGPPRLQAGGIRRRLRRPTGEARARIRPEEQHRRGIRVERQDFVQPHRGGGGIARQPAPGEWRRALPSHLRTGRGRRGGGGGGGVGAGGRIRLWRRQAVGGGRG